jgi:nucleoid-associated protein YgaU
MSKDENKNNTVEEPNSGSSGLGREAKIGVTVIGLLIIVFGVVVAWRFTRSGEEKAPAVAIATNDVKETKHHDHKIEVPPKEKPAKLIGSAAPTVVSATAASTKPPKTPTHDSNQWKLTNDRSKEKKSSGDAIPSAPPSFAIDPPKPANADRHNRYALDPPDAPRNNSSGYAIVEPTPPSPDMHDRPRYGNPPSPPMPAMSVGQYDSRDFQNDSSNRGRLGSGPRRSLSASSYGNPPPRREDGKYEVQPNDSYWTISEALYGTGAYFKALAQHNRGGDAGESQLQPGSLILAPQVAELEKSYPDLCPKPSRRDAMQSQSRSRTSTVGMRNPNRGGRTYTVAEGDTLFDIARYELGKASRWAEIYDLNRDVLGKDFNYLTPGTQLTLPDGEKPDVMAEPPTNKYRR